jgi:hypothetical protein
MSKITITEALAEIPTIKKRIENEQKFISGYLCRVNGIRDPFEKEGGTPIAIQQKFQSLKDLRQRWINIRSAIAKANSENTITIHGETKTISDWLTFRRELADVQTRFYQSLAEMLRNMRAAQLQKGYQMVEKDSGSMSDVVVNISEKTLNDDIARLDDILGMLDGQLSLKNATIQIDIP